MIGRKYTTLEIRKALTAWQPNFTDCKQVEIAAYRADLFACWPDEQEAVLRCVANLANEMPDKAKVGPLIAFEIVAKTLRREAVAQTE